MTMYNIQGREKSERVEKEREVHVHAELYASDRERQGKKKEHTSHRSRNAHTAVFSHQDIAVYVQVRG